MAEPPIGRRRVARELHFPACVHSQTEVHLRRKLLIVDDSRPLREGLALLLGSEYWIASVSTAEEALEQLERFEPDVMLLDLRLPGMNGEELLRRVATDRPRVRVVVITGTAGPDAGPRLFRQGARDFLQKPFGLSLLRERLEEVLKD